MERRRDKLSRNRTSLTRSPDSVTKHKLREKLELHRRSHDQERSRGRKKGNLKEKKVIKKRLKDSDNYVLEQGRLRLLNFSRTASDERVINRNSSYSFYETLIFAND